MRQFPAEFMALRIRKTLRVYFDSILPDTLIGTFWGMCKEPQTSPYSPRSFTELSPFTDTLKRSRKKQFPSNFLQKLVARSPPARQRSRSTHLKQPMKYRNIILLPLISGIAIAGEDLPVPARQATGGWSIASISAGPTWRSFGKLDYRGGSRSQNLLIPSQVGGDLLTLPAIGTTGDYADRTYTNGFINQDGSTATNGDTWFWGYDSAGQVSGDTLHFNATGSRSAYSEASNFTGGFSDDDHLRSLSPQIDLLLRPPSTFRSPFDGLLVSFWYFGDDSSNRYSNFSANQNRDDYRLDFTDTYDIGAIQPIIGAPYSGSLNGPGPLLGNLPLNRERLDVLIGGATADFSNSISTSIDLDGYSLALGPTISGTIADGWSWQTSAGVTLNVFRWSARETETLNVSLDGAPARVFQQWRDTNSDTDFRLGLYIKGDLILDLPQDWFVKASLQAEMAGSIDMKVGDSEYEFKPRGYALGLSLGRRF